MPAILWRLTKIRTEAMMSWWCLSGAVMQCQILQLIATKIKSTTVTIIPG